MRTLLFFLIVIFMMGYYINIIRSEEYETALDLVQEKTSFNDLDKYGDINGELKRLYSAEFQTCQNTLKQYETVIKTVDNYVQRYVSLFLITSNLHDYKIEDSNEEIIVDLEISIRGQDLAYLQSISRSLKDSGFQKNFSKLDAIFSNIARLKERNFKQRVLRSLVSFFSSIDYFSIFSDPSFYRPFFYFTIITVTWMFRYYLLHKLYPLVIVIVNSTIIWEGIVLYQKKIKEADIKIYVEALQMKKYASECDPANISWYQSLKNFIWQDKCVQYYQTAAKTAAEEVSLFFCIWETYFFYLVRTPINFFGSSIRDLTTEISGLVPWPFNYLMNIPIGILFIILGAFFILILCGKRLRLSFFGAALEIGDINAEPKKGKIFLTNTEREKPIRMLKPWTKNSFTRYCGKRWKLTTSKTVPEVPKQEDQTSTVAAGLNTEKSSEE